MTTRLDSCKQEVQLAKMAIDARHLLGLGYCGHGQDNYRWQASMLVPHLENALRHAKELSVDGLPEPDEPTP